MRPLSPWHAAVFLAALVLQPAPLLFARQEGGGQPVTIEADRISYDGAAHVYQAAGRVLVRFDQGTLQAEHLRFFVDQNRAEATGGVVIATGDDVLRGDRVEYDFSADTGVVTQGSMFIARNNFHIRGARILKEGPSRYRFEDVCLTTCDGPDPDWRITARELDLTVDGYGKAYHGAFYAGDIPLLYVPYLIFPAKTTRQSGFLFPHLAYSRNKLGWDVELPLYLVISRSADATFYQRIMDKRGFKEGVEFRYALGPDSYGTVYGDFLRDEARIREQSGALFRDWQSPQNRWSLYAHHYTAFRPDLYLRADVARVSDKWYFRDFSSHNYYLDHYSPGGTERFKKVSFVGDESLGALRSTLRLVKDWPSHNLTSSLRTTDDLTSPSNDAILQKLPEIALTGARRSVMGTPLYLDISASYSNNERGEGQRGHLVDLRPRVSLPLKVGGLFTFTPEVEVRGIYWEGKDDLAPERRGSLASYRAGASLSTSLSRDYGASLAGMEKVRHEITPELAYDYVPFNDPGELPDYAPPLAEKNSLEASLTNTLVARVREKDGVAAYREVLRVKVAQPYDIREARRSVDGSGHKRRPFGAIEMEVDVSPGRWASFTLRNRFDVNSGDWQRTAYDLRLEDGRGDSLSIGYHYVRDLLEETNLTARLAVSGSLDITYELRRNAFDQATHRNSLGFSYRRQCWTFGLTYADDVNDRRIMFSLALSGLGERETPRAGKQAEPVAGR